LLQEATAVGTISADDCYMRLLVLLQVSVVVATRGGDSWYKLAAECYKPDDDAARMPMAMQQEVGRISTLS
jgi:hypothetical protein